MEEINLTEYISILVKRWRTLFKVAFLALLFAGVLLLVMPSTYRGRALLIFPNNEQLGAGGILSQLSGLPSLLNLETSSNSPGTYNQILTSRSACQHVVDKLKLSTLDLDYEDVEKKLEVTVNKDGAMEICCYASSNWAKQGKLKWLEERLPNGSVNEKTALLAAEMTNTFIQYLEDFDKRHSLTTSRKNREFLESEVEKTKNMLSDAENDFRKFKENHPVVPPPDTVSIQIEQVTAIRTKQIEAESALSEASHSIQEARALVKDQEVLQNASKIIQENPVILSLKQDLAKAEVDRARLLENFTEDHPNVVAVTEQIEKIRRKISEEVTHVTTSETVQLNPVRQELIQQLATLEIGKSGIEARKKALDEVMSRLEQEISSLTKDQMTFVRLSRDVKALEAVYLSLLTELSKARIAEAKEPDGFTVIDEAIPEEKRFKPKRLLTLTAALFFGLIVGSFMAFLQEGKQRRKGKC